jgi:hypothetical protein
LCSLRSNFTFYGHLVHFVVIWYILWSFGTFCGHLVHFVVIWYIFHILVRCTENNLATLPETWKYLWNVSNDWFDIIVLSICRMFKKYWWLY